ncbi:pyrophosphatase [Arthrobacter phage Seahorse]|uniref:MazG-like nucleotide pyrophosphohydrolase n=1 Tax=Arthrobacter phage Seahorse TaxID=2419611 RepID=A0A3G3M5D5_9CAUD|nr:pyrophosphatase [Arthrobacter phage Seahorse]AYR01591.1 MazG-like nucleotide pyrophosphohydrolase [Arthrobacter phage Seahorse]
MTLTASTVEALRELQQTCGDTAASKGFHDDRPTEYRYESEPVYQSAKRDWQGNKLLLIVSEVVEAHDEIRNGRAADETYYPTATGEALLHSDGPFKPEGVPSEIADAVIRCFDFAYTEGFDLAGIIAEKLVYNASRERLHGKKF